MAVKSYVIQYPVRVPAVVNTNNPRNPIQVRWKSYRKGDIIMGELKHAANKPALVLVGGVLPVPIGAVREITTKEVESNASGSPAPADKADKKVKLPSMAKVKYIDALVFGAVAGVGVAFLAEKQKWIAEPDKKNKLIGAAIGACAGAYLLYRYKSIQADKNKEKE